MDDQEPTRVKKYKFLHLDEKEKISYLDELKRKIADHIFSSDDVLDTLVERFSPIVIELFYTS